MEPVRREEGSSKLEDQLTEIPDNEESTEEKASAATAFCWYGV